MNAQLQHRTRRSMTLALALLAGLALLSALTARAEAAKPDQILGAEVMAVNNLTCEVKIDVRLNSKGSMKNDIQVTVTGQGPGFTVVMDARRGATLRVERALGGPGLYTGSVMSRNPRTGAVVQTVGLGFLTCGV